MVKKLSTAAALVAAIFSSSAAADALGLYIGGQYWQQSTEGGFSSNSTVTNFNFDDEGQVSFYAAFEHPVPLIPNAKIKQTTLEMSGNQQFTDAYFFDGVSYTGNVATSIDVQQTDFTLYYEILDSDLITLDLGITGKKLSGDLAFNEVTIGKTTQAISGVLPMVYGAAKVGIPGTGIGLFAEGNFVTVDDHSLHDITAGISYEFMDNLAIDMALTAGYRSYSLQLEDLDDIYSDLTFDGVFAGIELHF